MKIYNSKEIVTSSECGDAPTTGRFSGGALAYLDDLTIIGSHQKCIQALELLRTEGPGIGLQVNLSKTVAAPSAAQFDQSSLAYHRYSEDIKVVGFNEGFELLGVPCGPTPYVQSWLDKYLTSQFFPALEIVENFPDPQVQFQYMYWVILHKTNHIYRNIPPQVLSHSFLGSIEAGLKSVFRVIFELHEEEFLDLHWKQACLPIKDGGFGICSVSDTAWSAFPASFLAASKQMLNFCSKEDLLNSSIGRHFTACLDPIKTVAGIDEIYEVDSLLERDLEGRSRLQNEFHSHFKRAAVSEYLSYVKESLPEYDIARTFSSLGSAGGMYLLANPAWHSRFTKSEFLMAGRLRLGLSLKHFPAKYVCKCKENLVKRVPYGEHGQHCFVCDEGGSRNGRHHSLRDVLFQLAKDAKLNCISEPDNLFITQTYIKNNKPCGLRPDLLACDVPFDTKEGKSVFYKDVILDVSVTYPCSETATKIYKSGEVKGASASKIYEKKMDKYTEAAGQQYRVMPIIFETFGFLHPSSEGFIRHLVGIAAEHSLTPKSVLHNYWFRRFSVALVRANVRLLMSKANIANEAIKKVQASSYDDVERSTVNNPTL